MHQHIEKFPSKMSGAEFSMMELRQIVVFHTRVFCLWSFYSARVWSISFWSFSVLNREEQYRNIVMDKTIEKNEAKWLIRRKKQKQQQKNKINIHRTKSWSIESEMMQHTIAKEAKQIHWILCRVKYVSIAVLFFAH